VTYLLLTASVLGIFSVYGFLVHKWLPIRPLLGAAVVMLTLTLVFDNVPQKISGIRLGFAPIEDFAYTLVALVLVPSLFNFLRSRL